MATIETFETNEPLLSELLSDIDPGADRLDAVLSLPPDRHAFDRFIQDRATSLLDLIEPATGRPVQGRDSEEVVELFGAPLQGGEWPESGEPAAADPSDDSPVDSGPTLLT